MYLNKWGWVRGGGGGGGGGGVNNLIRTVGSQTNKDWKMKGRYKKTFYQKKKTTQKQLSNKKKNIPK